MAFYRGAAVPAFRDNLLVASTTGPALLRLRFDEQNPGRLVTTEVLLTADSGGVRAVAVGPDGGIYFATATAVERLAPGASR